MTRPRQPAADAATLPTGPAVTRLPPGRRPDGRTLFGQTVTVERLDPARHGHELYASFRRSGEAERMWTYMGYGPFATFGRFRGWLDGLAGCQDPLFHAIRPLGGPASGMAAYMRITPEHGTIEIGHIWFAPRLRRSRAATEALWLMMRHAFADLGNRRLEWKCDALNAASRAAAERLGFAFEGVFARHMIVKGRNRDTAWYAITDAEWPAIDRALRTWLDDANFDARGRQRQALSALMAQARAGRTRG